MMWIKKFHDAKPFIAGDMTFLRELLHPANEVGFSGHPYSVAHAVLPSGTASLPHRLVNSTEVYFIISGHGVIEIDHEIATVATGDTILVPPNATQSLRNEGTEPLEFLCIVSPPWRKTDEEIDMP